MTPWLGTERCTPARRADWEPWALLAWFIAVLLLSGWWG